MMWYIPAVLLTVGIAIVSLWENPHLPPSLAMSDKFIHGVMYALLAITWIAPLAHRKPARVSPYIYVCLFVTMYGALIEILQRFCTLTRSGEMADLLADFIGALIGVLLIAVWRSLSTILR